MSAVKVYSTFKTLLDVVWSGIADGEVLLRNGTTVDGIATSGGGNNTADSGKLATFAGSGALTVSNRLAVTRGTGDTAATLYLVAADGNNYIVSGANVGATVNVTLPAGSGTLATLARPESLTNKKLGSLTTNGLVTTSAGDGTLGVTLTSGGANGATDSGKVALYGSTGALNAVGFNTYGSGIKFIATGGSGLSNTIVIADPGGGVDRTVTFDFGGPATSAVTYTFPTSNTSLASLGENIFNGAQSVSAPGAASTPALKLTGVPFSGTGTTSFPLLYINDANATASTTLNTAGTYFGINGDGSQDLMNLLKDGTSMVKVSSTGNTFVQQLAATRYGDSTNTAGFTVNTNGDILLNGARRVYASSITYIGGGGGNAVYLDGPTVVNGWSFSIAPDTRIGPGAVSVTTSCTAVTTTGVADALTLANGTNGQIKHIVHDVDGGSFVLTPTTKTGFTTVTSTNAGDTVTLQYFTTRGWMVIGSFGVVIA
jgi:hypothetical protein